LQRIMTVKPEERTPSFTPDTLKDLFRFYKSNNVTDPKVYDTATNVIKDVLTNPKASDELKITTAKNTFSNDNKGMLTELGADYKDPRTGNTISGRYAAYMRLTSADVTKEMARLGAKDASVWNGYVDWTMSSFATELFGKDVQDLNKFKDLKGANLHWDTENKEFLMKPKIVSYHIAGKEGITETQRIQLQTTINRINNGITGLKNIAKVNPNVNVEAFIYESLDAMGFKYGPGNPTGLPDELVKSVIGERVRQELKKKIGDK
jgi:hypothetical protein